MKERFKKIALIKNILFFSVLGVLTAIGLLWPLRPKTSEIEKRELTAFPKLTAKGLMDGSFTSGLDKWYADTYPLRELFISGSHRLKSLYGDRSEQLIITDQPADDIPDPVTRPSGPQPTAEDTAPPPTEPPAQPTEDSGQGSADVTGEKIGSVYVSGNAGYSLYYFSKAPAERYAAFIDRAHELLGDGVQIYSLIVPLSSGIVLDKSLQKSVGVSDQRAAIEYMNSLMDPAVHALNIYDTMAEHSGEYIYFRTDHHWTARGAYYAYVEFCRSKGVTPHTLDEFEKKEYPGFLGSFYSDTRSEAMKRDPDTVEAWVPMGTNSMIYLDSKGEEIKWNVVRNASSYAAGNKYYCFAGSDQSYAYAHNPEISDGSACVIVKDSFGNAFIPFLIDHYEHIYWIDFRYYKGKLQDLVQEKNIGDVIFCFNIYNPSSNNALPLMERLIKE